MSSYPPRTPASAVSPPSHGRLLRLFLPAIWNDGIARMGAGLGILCMFLAAYFAFIANHNIALLWILALLSFLFASYRVWAGAYRQYLQERERNELPELKGQITTVMGSKGQLQTRYLQPLTGGNVRTWIVNERRMP